MRDARDFIAKIRNLFSTGTLQKRYDDGAVQVMTHTERVLEKHEAFFYGFIAKAKNGKAIVFCQGGNYNDYEILPILKADDVTAPELEEGDAALYTGEGAVIIVREAGGVEVLAKGSGAIKIIAEDGAFYFANGKNNIYNVFIGLIDEIKTLITTGSPASQVINEASKQKLDMYKNKVKELFAEAE
jgi:phage gp45-like